MTTFRKGDTVFRTRGIAGIRAYQPIVVTEGGKSHIKVRMENGVESDWLSANSFGLNRRAHPDHVCWLIIYRDAAGNVSSVVKNTRRSADEFMGVVRGAQGHAIVSAKKITVPLDYVGVA